MTPIGSIALAAAILAFAPTGVMALVGGPVWAIVATYAVTAIGIVFVLNEGPTA